MNEFMPLLVSTLGWALLHFLWQGLLLGLGTAAVLMLMGNASPQARYLVTAAALALCVLLPLLGVAQALQPAASLPALAAQGMHEAGQPAATAALPFAATVPLAPEWREALQVRMPLIVALWSLGAAALALRMALGLTWVAQAGGPGNGRENAHWQARLDALAQRMALPRRVLLRVVDELEGPVAARIWRPVVLVPAALVARMPPDWLEALLAHELAHVRRHDYLVNLLQSAVEALLFYHPVVWWLSRRMRIERELIADELAARTLGQPRQLALALDYLAQSRATPNAHLALAADGGLLMSRIQRLVRPRHQTLSWKLALPILGLSVACLSVFAQSGAPVATGDSAATATTVATAATAGPATTVATAATAPTAATATTAATAATAATGTSMAVDGTLRVHREGGVDYAVLGAGEGDSIKFSGNYDDLADVRKLRGIHGNDLIWFRRDGEAYVIRDAALVSRARAAWKPTEPVSSEMEVLGEQMEVHGKRMEAIGERMEAVTGGSEALHGRMEALGERMSALSEQMEPIAEKMQVAGDRAELERLSAQADGLSAQMETLGAEMETLGGQLEREQAPLTALGKEMEIASQPMNALGEQMGVLGEQMEKLSEAANLATLAIIEEGVRDGKAVRLEQSAQQ